MKSLSKRIIAFLVIVMIALLGTTISNAADITASLSSSNKLVAGETVEINISVSEAVYGISATLSYDKDVFESATVSSSVATSADLSNNVIVIENGSEMPAGVIGKITLKVKDSISKSSAKVSLSSGKATDKNVTTQNLNNPSITIKSDADATTDSTPAEKNEVMPATTNKDNNTNSAKTITTTKSNKKILKAGDTSTVVIISVLSVVTIVAIMGFVRYAKNKDIK